MRAACFRAGGNGARGGPAVAGVVSAPNDRARPRERIVINAPAERGGEAGGRGGREMMSPLTHVHRIRPRAILLSAQTGS